VFLDEYKSSTKSRAVLIQYSEMQCLLLFSAALVVLVTTGHSYYIGVSQYDITGPAAEINMVSRSECMSVLYVSVVNVLPHVRL